MSTLYRVEISTARGPGNSNWRASYDIVARTNWGAVQKAMNIARAVAKAEAQDVSVDDPLVVRLSPLEDAP